MAIILAKIKYFYKMSNFYPSGISHLTYCVTTKKIKIWQCNLLDFSQDFQILFHTG